MDQGVSGKKCNSGGTKGFYREQLGFSFKSGQVRNFTPEM